jgi:hypothetical protein
MNVQQDRSQVWLVLLASLVCGPAAALAQVSTSAEEEPAAPREIRLRFVPTVVRKAPAPEESVPRPLTIRAGMLAALVDELAGRHVRILNGSVVGVLEPHAFLIEPATTYLKPKGFRDRLVVLIDSGELRVPDKLIVGATVTVTGIARTLLGVQVTRDVPWPAELHPENVERWEVRGAVVADSVQTPDGAELTQRR